jgi:hypothetical protein
MEVSFIFVWYWACDEPVCAKINVRDIVHCVDCKYQISLNPFFRDVMLCGLIEIHIHCGWMYCSDLQGKSKKTTILRKKFCTTLRCCILQYIFFGDHSQNTTPLLNVLGDKKCVDKKHYLTLCMKFACFIMKMHETIPDMMACVLEDPWSTLCKICFYHIHELHHLLLPA